MFYIHAISRTTKSQGPVRIDNEYVTILFQTQLAHATFFQTHEEAEAVAQTLIYGIFSDYRIRETDITPDPRPRTPLRITPKN